MELLDQRGAPEREGGGIEWTVKFPPDGKPFAPPVGPHVFVAECRDITGVVSHTEFRIEVLPGPQGKENLIYLVDDDRAKMLDQHPLNYEQNSHAFWVDILDGYNWDWWDTKDGQVYTREVPIRRVGDATTVIWLADFDDQGPQDAYLLKVCAKLGNYLNSYVKVGGNLIIIGKDPVYDTMYWPDCPKVYDPDKRTSITSVDFTPRASEADSSKIYDFMWEAFGILKMQIASPPIPFKTAVPCEAGWDTLATDAIPGTTWKRMDNAFYITEVRDDIDVHKMFSMIPLDNSDHPTGPAQCERGGLEPMRLVGVYVAGDGTRGYAAYIGVPPWFFDHDQVKVMIRRLLEMFGEPRTP